jgi:hypothetical protein
MTTVIGSIINRNIAEIAEAVGRSSRSMIKRASSSLAF